MLNNLSSYSLLCCREGFLSSWPSSGPTLQGAQLCAEDPRGGCSFPGMVSQGQRRRRSTSLDLLATMLLMLARMWLAFWAASAHCQLMSSISCPAFHPQESPKSFSAGPLPVASSPSVYSYLGLPQHRCRTLHLDCVDKVPFFIPFCSPCKS